MGRTVDIIVPIYNAYDDLTKCINSIKQNTDLNKHRLILIDDMSTDERVAAFIDNLLDDHIVVIHNEKNQGFSANINIGFRQSLDNDVILLNSDTIVTADWVEKMLACAYSDDTIATVTPLSNNATICSVPEYYEENDLPAGYTVQQYAKLIEDCSLKKYPTIPVAHGFCMFVKREVIDKVGYFDAETFGRGYGEENDFCYRAEQLGYHHVMCDNTFIYHSGTGSFLTEEKRRYIEEHEQIIVDRYPAQHHNTVIYCAGHFNEDIRTNIKIQTLLKNGKKNILYLLHSDFRKDSEDHTGGTQFHVRDLCNGLKNRANIFVAARNHNYLNITGYIGNDELFFQFYIGDVPAFPVYRDVRFAELYKNILESFRIDIVHIHHTSALTLELYYQAAKKNIPVFATLHDFYTVCPNVKLVNEKEEFCKDIAGAKMCENCLKKKQHVMAPLEFQNTWRREHCKALQLCAQIFVPSENTRDIFISYYPELKQKLFVITHGSDSLKSMQSEEPTMEEKVFHVAFIGGISREKGSLCTADLIQHGPSDIQWYLFGILGTPELVNLKKKNCIKTGEYERDELPELIKKYNIDLICILPIWAETFSYTLSEAILCGIPVIVKDIGALGERVRQLQCGWIVPKDADYKEILQIIDKIKDKGEMYQAKKSKLQNIKLKTTEQMCDEYWSVYEKAWKKQPVEHMEEINYTWLLQGRGKALGNPLLQGVDNHIYEQLALTEQQLKDIKNSTTYKVAKTISRAKIPFKSQLKKALIFGNAFLKKGR